MLIRWPEVPEINFGTYWFWYSAILVLSAFGSVACFIAFDHQCICIFGSRHCTRNNNYIVSHCNDSRPTNIARHFSVTTKTTVLYIFKLQQEYLFCHMQCVYYVCGHSFLSLWSTFCWMQPFACSLLPKLFSFCAEKRWNWSRRRRRRKPT